MVDNYTEEEDSDENIDVKNDIFNYKGYFIENEEEEEKKFYEFGAHFPYKYLYQKLEIIAKEREEKQKELENKLKEKDSKEYQSTNENSKKNESLKGLLNAFQKKGKSRNRENIGIGLTYMPKMNKKNVNNLNFIDNVEINLVKSTNGQNKKKSKDNKIKNSSKNSTRTKIINNKKSNRCISKIVDKKNNKLDNKQIKIRKRNNHNRLNINNSLDNNIIYINIFSKTKLSDKPNKKNLTQDVPFTKISFNLNKKLKSFEHSKEKLKRQIFTNVKKENGFNKKIINNFRNNNKFSYAKYYGYQNTKNISNSKNILSKDKNVKKNIKKNSLISTSNQKGSNSNNKSNKNSNLNIRNNIIDIKVKSIKENNFTDNNKNNLLFNSKKNSQVKIINGTNYKSYFNESNKKKSQEFIENLGKKQKYISRNNNIPLFSNVSQNNTNKIFNSVTNINDRKKINTKYNSIEINLNSKTNFEDLNQQLNPEISKKKIEKNIFTNQNINKINDNSKNNFSKKNSIEKTSNKKPSMENIKNKLNIINIK